MMTPEERWRKIENALQTAAELHADNERRHEALLADRAEINVLHKDLLRSQIDLYKSQEKLAATMGTLTQAMISVNSTMETLTQAMISMSGKWDRVLDLAEKFLLGGSGNGRGNQ